MASRSLKKPPFVSYKLLKKVLSLTPNPNKPIRTWSRSSMICPEFVGYTFEVHNGKSFVKVTVTEDKVFHRLGEFSFTRKQPQRAKSNTKVSNS